MNRRAGFTIVEMLTVVGVLAVLMGLVSTGAVSALRTARGRRAEAMRQAIQTGMWSYRAAKGSWPWSGGGGAASEDQGGEEEEAPSTNAGSWQIKKDKYDKAMYEMVKMTYNDKRPVLDLNGLVAIRKTAAANDRAHGMDFREALAKSRKNGKLIMSDWTFGYARKADARFRRYKVTYNARTDSVKVELNDNNDGYNE